MKSLTTLAFTLIALATTVASEPPDIRQGLVAYWPMESTDGVTTSDATSFSNHLNVVNMTSGNFTAGRFGNAASLVNSSATYMTNLHATENVTGLPIYNARSYTISMWVKGAAQTNRYLFSEGNTTDTDPLLILQTGNANNTNKLDVIIRNDTTGALVNHVVSTAVVFDNTWHHVAWVDDRGNARLYVDGNLDTANFNYSPAGTFTFNTTAIGTLVRTSVATGNIFNGQIDDVAVWERPLTQNEVRQMMTNSLQAPVPVLAPHVLVQPTNTLRLGDRLTLKAVGVRPLAYQWAKGDVDIQDDTSSTYVLSNLTQGDSGSYTVRVTQPDGDVTSSPAVVTVLPDAPADLRNGLVSFWPFEEILFNDEGTISSTPDVYSRNDINLFPYPFLNQPPGQFGSAVSFDGSTQYGVRASGFPIYNNPGFSVSFWVNGGLQNDRRIFAEDATNNQFTLFSIGSQGAGTEGTLRVFIRSDNNVLLRDRVSTRPALDGTWHHVVWTDDNGWAKLYIDGTLDETEFTYTRGLLTANRTAIAALARTPLAAQFLGAIDELAVWNRVLNYTEIQEIRSTSVPPPVAPIPPDITQQPTNQSVFTQGAATFSVVAIGTAPLQAQWRKNSNNITDATNFTLAFTSAALADAGHYDVVISNSAGSITSQVATLTVTLRPPPPEQLKIDFNNIGQETPGDTQPGFSSFALDSFGPGPFRRSFGGAELTVSGVGVSLQSRARATPGNSATLTEAQLFRDFIFSPDTTVDQGMDILVSFMPPDTLYDVTIWSFDSSSANNRISDWSANGSPVQTAYTFDGNVLPTTNGQNRFTFPAQTDSGGNILIQGRRNSAAAGANNVFINALQLIPRELQILSIQHIAFDSTLRLTVKLRDAAAGHRLLQKTSLTDTEWTEVVDAVYMVPDNGVQEIIAPVPATSTRFYRIEELQ